MKRPTRIPPASHDRGLKMVLFVFIIAGLWLSWVLTVNPKALDNGPQLIPQWLSNLAPGPAQAAHTDTSQADGVLQGAPSLSAAFIERVFKQAHSPAQGTGQDLYTLSQAYGIDDAYALAFFKEESQFGTTGVARLTKSLGNIRCTAGYTCRYGYRSYADYPSGYADWYQLIVNVYLHQWHLRMVQQIVPRYAPATDGNDPAAYSVAILQSVAMWRSQSQAGGKQGD